jgi:phosphatidylinositol alpha-1,6-mannosyltransferase
MAGVAAIGGAGSGADEAIAHGETGLLVDGSDADAIARALATVLGDRERAAAMGAAGRQRALDAFTWSSRARAVAAHLALADAV